MFWKSIRSYVHQAYVVARQNASLMRRSVCRTGELELLALLRNGETPLSEDHPVKALGYLNARQLLTREQQHQQTSSDTREVRR